MKGLVTDLMFPNKFATWRNVEIKSFIKNFDVDILVFKVDGFAGNKFDFDWDFINENNLLNEYNILIFDEKYNDINKYNKNIDGTKFNGKFKGSYLLTKKTDFDLNCYDFIYHIFLMNYLSFNKNYQVEKTKQFIHLYPGGGISDLKFVSLIDQNTNIISTHPLTTDIIKKLNYLNYIELKCGTLMEKNDSFFTRPIKKNNETLNICFSSMGVGDDKGNDTYYSLVEYYKDFPEKNIKFFGLGNVKKDNNIECHQPMDYKSLGKFYRDNIDVYINLETGKLLNGWPLGIESIINGSVLITTDVHNVHDRYFFQNSGIFVIETFMDLIRTVEYLNDNKELLQHYSNIIQHNIEKYISYENNQEKIFNYIKKIIYKK